MADNIYPDSSNSKFDIKYSQRLLFPSDLNNRSAAVGTESVVSEETDNGEIPGIDSVLAVEQSLTADRSIDLNGFNLAINNGVALVMEVNGLSGAVRLANYGAGTFTDTAAFLLAVDIDGNVIEVNPGSLGSSYSDEQAQDAVGNILTDSDTIDFSYDDVTPKVTAAVRYQMSITADTSGLKLSGDSDTPGNSKYYGTDGSGAKGFFDLPSGGSSPSRFGFPGEDDTAGEFRDFNMNGFTWSVYDGGSYLSASAISVEATIGDKHIQLDATGFSIVDGTEGAGKVWTSDASGLGSWQDLPGGGGSFALTNGNGTTANGTAVDLGGVQTADISINGNNFQFNRSGASSYTDQISDSSYQYISSWTLQGGYIQVWKKSSNETAEFNLNNSGPFPHAYVISTDGTWTASLDVYSYSAILSGKNSGGSAQYMEVNVDGISFDTSILTNLTLNFRKLPVYADEAAAVAAGLNSGRVFRDSSGFLHVKL